MRALIEVLLGTGMRISEALTLDRESINRETREAEIIGKGNMHRTVFFGPQCLRDRPAQPIPRSGVAKR